MAKGEKKWIQTAEKITPTSPGAQISAPHRGYWLADRTLRLVHVDGAWEELFGLPLRAVEGKTGMDWVHIDDHAAAAKPVLDLIAGRPVTIRLRLRLRGRFQLCTVAVQPLFDPCGRFAGAHGFTRMTNAQPTDQAAAGGNIIAMGNFLPPPPTRDKNR